MKIARAKFERGKRYGFIDEEGRFYPATERLVEILKIIDNPGLLDTLMVEMDPLAPGEYQLLPPCKPSKIIAVGLNYTDHAEEFGKPVPDEPIIFLKPPSAVIGPDEEIIYPSQASRVDYEAELAVVISKPCRGVSPDEAPDYILGFTCGNDVTERVFQKKDGQWTRAKGFDTFCPLGPVVETSLNPYEGLTITSRVNGQTRQLSSTANMIWGVNELVSFISSIMTLRTGDVILTGTPAGVGELNPGDTVEIEISGIGVLSNPVVKQDKNK